MSLNTVLKFYVGKNIQLKFKNELSQGPTEGKLEALVDPDDGEVLAGFYTLHAKMMYGDPRGGSQPVQVTLPMTFSADDVLWISEGPTDRKEPSSIAVPGGNRTPGGLHLGG